MPETGESQGRSLSNPDADYEAKMIFMFRQLDLNGNGVIEGSELRAVFKLLDQAFDDAKLDLLLKAFDTNGDGLIQYAEFVAWILARNDEWDGARAELQNEKALVEASAAAVSVAGWTMKDVTVQDLSGEPDPDDLYGDGWPEFKVSANYAWTVAELKKAIEKQTGIPASLQELMATDGALADTELLSSTRLEGVPQKVPGRSSWGSRRIQKGPYMCPLRLDCSFKTKQPAGDAALVPIDPFGSRLKMAGTMTMGKWQHDEVAPRAARGVGR